MNCTNKECFPIPLSPASHNTADNISGVNSVWEYFYDYGYNQNLSDFTFEYFYPSNGSCESENGGVWIQIPGIGLGDNIYPNIPTLLDALQALGVDCNGLTAGQCQNQTNSVLGYGMTTSGIGAGACPDTGCPTCGGEEGCPEGMIDDTSPYWPLCVKCYTGSTNDSNITGGPPECDCCRPMDEPEEKLTCYRCSKKGGNTVQAIQFPNNLSAWANFNFQGECPKGWTTDPDPCPPPVSTAGMGLPPKNRRQEKPKRELRENFIYRLQKLAGIKK